MKSTITGCWAILALSIVLQGLSGCKKVLDYIGQHPGGAADAWEIKTLGYQGFYGDSETLTFSYNAWKNPVSVTRPDPRTGAPNYFFTYDKWNRLSNLICAYAGGVAPNRIETWNKYFYDGKGRIVVDSLYSFPDLVNGNPVPGEHSSLSAYYFEYDSYGRIIKETWQPEGGYPPLVSTYAYNADGNLAGPAYDNKINFRQTNKIWMFLDRNYSVNNALPATYTYNKAKLPLTIDCPEGQAMEFHVSTNNSILFSSAKIEYFMP
ncbi:MAG TPA: hypothetical protein VL727_22040 [Puia sp.]|nr:hypothetical protein [Puia sp.]